MTTLKVYLDYPVFGRQLEEMVCPMLQGQLSCLSVYNIGVLWPNGWMDPDATWYRGRPQPQVTVC